MPEHGSLTSSTVMGQCKDNLQSENGKLLEYTLPCGAERCFDLGVLNIYVTAITINTET